MGNDARWIQAIRERFRQAPFEEADALFVQLDQLGELNVDDARQYTQRFADAPAAVFRVHPQALYGGAFWKQGVSHEPQRMRRLQGMLALAKPWLTQQAVRETIDVRDTSVHGDLRELLDQAWRQGHPAVQQDVLTVGFAQRHRATPSQRLAWQDRLDAWMADAGPDESAWAMRLLQAAAGSPIDAVEPVTVSMDPVASNAWWPVYRESPWAALLRPGPVLDDGKWPDLIRELRHNFDADRQLASVLLAVRLGLQNALTDQTGVPAWHEDVLPIARLAEHSMENDSLDPLRAKTLYYQAKPRHQTAVVLLWPLFNQPMPWDLLIPPFGWSEPAPLPTLKTWPLIEQALPADAPRPCVNQMRLDMPPHKDNMAEPFLRLRAWSVIHRDALLKHRSFTDVLWPGGPD